MSDEKPKSDFEKLMEHAAQVNRFAGIEGHKWERLAPPQQAEVGWEDVQKLSAKKDGTDAG